jgi:hypothetical protein
MSSIFIAVGTERKVAILVSAQMIYLGKLMTQGRHFQVNASGRLAKHTGLLARRCAQLLPSCLSDEIRVAFVIVECP